MSAVLSLPDLFDLPDLATPEAFVAWMETQPRKLEMAGGRLVMMAGGSNPHATIATNTLAALHTRLRGGPCRPYNSDFMVQLGLQDRFYPDASVACGETRDYTDHPVLVVEVLSPTTRRFDLQVKLPAYCEHQGSATSSISPRTSRGRGSTGRTGTSRSSSPGPTPRSRCPGSACGYRSPSCTRTSPSPERRSER
jgi:Putative restriction endonuclease